VRICKYLCVSVRISEWVWSVSKYYLRGQRFRDRSARFRKFIFLVKRGHNLWGRYNRRGVVVIFVTLVRLTVWSGYTSVTIRGFDEFACLDDRRARRNNFTSTFYVPHVPICIQFVPTNIFSVLLDRVAHNVCAVPLFEPRRCDLDRKRTTC